MPKTLLLADDSITIQKVVGIIFASEDYSVTTVNNGEDALSKARELKPDVVLADVVMPRKNGYELCEAMKNDAALRDTPVVLLAGTFEAFDEARAKAVRADGWIQKPFESAALVGKVREIVEGIAPAAAPSLPYVTASSARPAPPTVVPPPRGVPAPPGVRPLPGQPSAPAATSATDPQPFRPPSPPPAPFAARPPMAPVPPVPPPPPFAARPPSPPAPPIPAPPVPGPTFRAPPPPPPLETEPPRPSASFAAPPPAQPPAPFAIPLPPPPPPPIATVPPPTAAPFAAPPPPLAVPLAAPTAPVASLDELDFSGASFDEPLTPPSPPQPPPPPVFAAPPAAVTVPPPTAAPFAAPPPPLAVPVAPPPALASFAAPLPLPAPSSPPPAPAISTQKVAPPAEPEMELDFDIDEAAAPIDLADLAAEEISDEEAFSTGEVHADVTPLAPAAPSASSDPFADLFGDEGRTPPALELHPPEEALTEAREEPDLAAGLPSLDLDADADAEQLPTLELEPEAELPSLDMASGDEAVSPLDLDSPPFEREPELAADESDSPFRLDADPRPFRPAVETPSFEDLGSRPFEVEAAREHEPAFTAMPGFPPVEPAPAHDLVAAHGLEAAHEPAPAHELEAATATDAEAELAPPPPIAMAADEAVLREALSRASQETIERVVWEVVPQLAETIIREHLERLMKDRKIS